MGRFKNRVLLASCATALFAFVHSGLFAQQYEFTGDLSLQGFVADGQNPFWDYSQTNGIVSEDTQFLAVLNGFYRTYLSELSDLEVGASFFTDVYRRGQNNLRANEYFVAWKWRNFRATLGARARPEKFMGISSVNGDVLWSNNARPMPGLEVGTVTPWQVLPWLGLEGAIAHFWLDQDRFVTGAYVHYKYLALNFRTSENSNLRVGLQHFAQWGGVSPIYGAQPAGFSDYWKVFFGIAGAEALGIDNDEPALGNHMGSYQINYRQELNNGSISVYHQHLFENSEGLKFQNFPDGVWGVFWELPDYSAVRGLIYEFVHTKDNNAPNSPLDPQDYFNHYLYESGWTYKSRGLGIPFLIPNSPTDPAFPNTRVIAHHLGARISSFDEQWDIRLMGSYVTNLGRWQAPFDPEENVFYGHARIRRLINENMQAGFTIGTDISNINQDNFAISFSFKYLIGGQLRIVPEELN